MKVQEKQQIVEELVGKLSGASAFYLTDFTGLSVKKITDLRARLRPARLNGMKSVARWPSIQT